MTVTKNLEENYLLSIAAISVINKIYLFISRRELSFQVFVILFCSFIISKNDFRLRFLMYIFNVRQNGGVFEKLRK